MGQPFLNGPSANDFPSAQQPNSESLQFPTESAGILQFVPWQVSLEIVGQASVLQSSWILGLSISKQESLKHRTTLVFIPPPQDFEH